MTIRLWQLAAAFLILTAVFTVSLVMTSNANDRTKRVADRADVLSKQNKRVAATAKSLAATVAAQEGELQAERTAQVAALHAVDVRNCASTHSIVKGLEGLVERSVARGDTSGIPDLTARQRTALESIRAKRIASDERYLADLRRSDCMGVAPLPPLGSKP